MALDENFIHDLKAKNDIVDVVGKYCVLKKRGKLLGLLSVAGTFGKNAVVYG